MDSWIRKAQVFRVGGVASEPSDASTQERHLNESGFSRVIELTELYIRDLTG